ncbi:branched-chain amino acid transport system / permease component family protein [Paraburkholderia xenovorans LB400]|uniref:Amino acid/amide ABC transporter membrane protein 2, HAAT family n=1 Tax=Paraburkholderia xenovorans (strain LB400) TaxID=266265 RepID=Q13GP7_PARXL|nr:branched-chain amino acid ABC transporter permease [Paraburkholderia xenovorans]ABE36742.1 amino acid/amide ABC transporter membrane protein 2, HAAT family [Paraburkholderia xenovorans LB400]AIP34791.1 branched-chain amino acid transport system / permease component family protein [Paraburkholderia xenovorans LB400]
MISRSMALCTTVIGIAVLGLPWIGNSFAVTTAIAVLYLAYQALAWNLTGGLAGQFSLGNTIFIGAGAYTSTYLFLTFGLSPWFGLIAGALLAVVLAYLIGLLTFRLNLRGLYFAMVTLALAQMVQVLVENMPSLGGAYGLLIPVRGTSFAAFQFESRAAYYYIVLGMVTGAACLMTAIRRGRAGLMLDGLRENENAARAVGVPIVRNMQIAFGLSACLAAVGGTFIAQYTLFIDPKSTFAWTEAVYFLLPAVVGGSRHWWGPVIGAILLGVVSDGTQLLFGDSIKGLPQIIYGIVVIIVVMRTRVGIADWFLQQWHARQHAAQDTAPEKSRGAA